MTFLAEPLLDIHRRRDRDGMPVNDRRLARAIDAGEVIRIAPGSFVIAAEWRTLAPIQRHQVFVTEIADRARGSLTISHHAASALLGIDRIGPWPSVVDTLVPRRTGGRSTGLVRRRTTTTGDIETIPWRGHFVTTPAQTAVHLAQEASFTAGVVAVDQALWTKRAGGPLATVGEVQARLDAAPPQGRGRGRAESAIEFGTSLSDSVRESQSRVLIHRLGFPPPVLQQRFDLELGGVAFTDFFWREHSHIGEFDGVGKYIDPAWARGRTPEQVLIEEKDRGDELRRQVRTLSRWRIPALRDARLLFDILTVDGLPSSRPRPPAGLVLA